VCVYRVFSKPTFPFHLSCGRILPPIPLTCRPWRAWQLSHKFFSASSLLPFSTTRRQKINYQLKIGFGQPTDSGIFNSNRDDISRIPVPSTHPTSTLIVSFLVRPITSRSSPSLTDRQRLSLRIIHSRNTVNSFSPPITNLPFASSCLATRCQSVAGSCSIDTSYLYLRRRIDGPSSCFFFVFPLWTFHPRYCQPLFTPYHKFSRTFCHPAPHYFTSFSPISLPSHAARLITLPHLQSVPIRPVLRTFNTFIPCILLICRSRTFSHLILHFLHLIMNLHLFSLFLRNAVTTTSALSLPKNSLANYNNP